MLAKLWMIWSRQADRKEAFFVGVSRYSILDIWCLIFDARQIMDDLVPTGRPEGGIFCRGFSIFDTRYLMFDFWCWPNHGWFGPDMSTGRRHFFRGYWSERSGDPVTRECSILDDTNLFPLRRQANPPIGMIRKGESFSRANPGDFKSFSSANLILPISI